MSCQEDVLNIGRKLEKMISNKAEDPTVALDMLIRLKKLPMTLEVLQKTRIGMTVNNFRKTTKNEEVIMLSKSLIKIWKKLLSEGNSSQSSSGSNLSRSSSVASNLSKDGDDSRDSGETSEEKKDKDIDRGASREDDDSPPIATSASQSSHSSKIEHNTCDPIRIKCREMLAKALEVTPEPENSGNHVEIAADIEERIYEEFENTGLKYKNRVRSRVSNLKDSKNPQLRENVLVGTIKPETIAVMSSAEMANDAMKKLREEYTKQAINDHQMTMQTGTVTDLLKCGKCGKRKCTYNQVQTRSADEPMTTFVFCMECGHRWKFC